MNSSAAASAGKRLCLRREGRALEKDQKDLEKRVGWLVSTGELWRSRSSRGGRRLRAGAQGVPAASGSLGLPALCSSQPRFSQRAAYQPLM